jgi:carbon storage regulator CsrA
VELIDAGEKQRIILGDKVVITVVKIRADKVLIGFEADASVAIDRSEIRALIEANGGRRASSKV